MVETKVTPLVGVWIEIKVSSVTTMGNIVTPLVGVWIEIRVGLCTGVF